MLSLLQRTRRISRNKTKINLTKTKIQTRTISYSTISRTKEKQNDDQTEQEDQTIITTNQTKQIKYLRPPLPPLKLMKIRGRKTSDDFYQQFQTTTTTTISKKKLILEQEEEEQSKHFIASSRIQDRISQLKLSLGLNDIKKFMKMVLEIEKDLGFERIQKIDYAHDNQNNNINLNLINQVIRSRIKKSNNNQEQSPITMIKKRDNNDQNEFNQRKLRLDEIITKSIFNLFFRKCFVLMLEYEQTNSDHQKFELEFLVFEWMNNFKYNNEDWIKVHEIVDVHLLAIILKGILTLNKPKITILDYMDWIEPYNELKPNSLNLNRIFKSIIFNTTHLNFLGDFDRFKALEKLKRFINLEFEKLNNNNNNNNNQQHEQKQNDYDFEDDDHNYKRKFNLLTQLNHEVKILDELWKNESFDEHKNDDEHFKSIDVPLICLDPVLKPLKPNEDKKTTKRQIPMRLNNLLKNIKTIENTTKEINRNQTIKEDEEKDEYERQLILEYSGYDSALGEWYESHLKLNEINLKLGKIKNSNNKSLQSWMFDWWSNLKIWLDDLNLKFPLDQPLPGSQNKKTSIETELRLIKVLPNELISKVTIVEIMREMSNSQLNDGCKSIGLFISIGKSIENEWYAQTIKSLPELNTKLINNIKKQQQQRKRDDENENENENVNNNDQEVLNDDELIRLNLKKHLKDYYFDLRSIHGDKIDWSINQRAKVGALVLKGLLESAKINRSTVLEDGSLYEEIQPAFYQTTQYFEGKRVGVTKMNEAVVERLNIDPANVSLHPRYLPMICKPIPWTNPKNGGYLVHGAPLMRTKDSPEQLIHLIETDKSNQLEMIYKSLDKLGETSWNINQNIFKIMTIVWNSGKSLGGIPARDDESDSNQELNNNNKDEIDEKIIKDVLNLNIDELDQISDSPRSEGEKKEIFRSWLASKRSAYGQRCCVNYQLEIAKAYLNETFYYPHNLDFRGRAYPIPANLNHIGDDISRGLLCFGIKKKLGKIGLRWLKIHLSNKFGFDKASLDQRERFTEDHLNEIFDSVDHPLDGKGWWLESEDPWQTLAACWELTMALRSENPEGYESNLPIHQDGSCNGLQHYAALGGDIVGGKEVNLIEGIKPGDVYSKVSEEVNKLIDEDVKNGHDIAKALQGHIKRKVVKQTVMTTVYGVTFVGAREQIRKQLKDLGVIPIPNLYISAAYVATLVLRSIGEVFKGAVGIQKWLTYIARIVSKSIPPERIERIIIEEKERKKNKSIRESKDDVDKNEKKSKIKIKKKSSSLENLRDEEELMTSMTWTTPLGLVVCQPYRTQNRTQISTVLQTVFIADPHEPAQADSRSQASAFPPNFIHSLDATHMMLTALSCQEITFAAVHDSYWTHASDIDYMNLKLREAFVRLHSTDILKNLAQEVRHRYEGYLIPKSLISHRMIKDLKEMGLDLEKVMDSTSSKNDHLNNRYVKLVDLIPDIPIRGDLDIKQVLNSKYFFS